MKITWLILGVIGLDISEAVSELPTSPSLVGGGNITEQRAYVSRLQAAAAETSFEANFVPRDPWRAIDEATNYVKTDGVEFCGKIVDVSKEGVRIEGSFGDLFQTSYYPSESGYSDYFVANFPFSVVNDQIISEGQHLMAWYVGTYTYSTVNGGSRTIKKLDYGIPCNPPAELIKRQIEAARAKSLAEKKKAEQGQIAAVKFLEPKATNGDDNAQCELGLHYLNGLGCETNRDTAIYWLQKAAAQGNLRASKKLDTLKP
jgi:TPR repeat protein